MKREKTIPLIFIITSLIFCISIGCRKNAIEPNATLRFDADTIFLDTVITELGTSTQELKVYNPYSKSVVISSIKMAEGSSSEFIFNVNGMGTGEKTNIELKPKDSLFIFIQAKLKKNNVDTVVFHQDKLLFSINDKVQDVKVVSWGRDATFYKNHNLQTTTWQAGKSVLIFDSVVVDVGQTLTIEEGAMVLFKPKANLVIKGTLIVKGTIAKPVIFKGYRLQESYQNLPGQWGSIIIASTSTGNTIQNAIITDGTSGFQLRKSTNKIDLSLENVLVKFMSYSGLSCCGAKVKAVNCVFANCNAYALELNEGGDYQFIHSTVSNSNNIGSIRNTRSVIIGNYKTDASKSPKNLVQASFQNCIITGSSKDEILTDSVIGALYNLHFTSCLLKLSSKIGYMDASSFLLKDNDNLFLSSDKDFELDSNSVARNKGNVGIAFLYPHDYKGRSRIADLKPDLGAYEYFKDTTKVHH